VKAALPALGAGSSIVLTGSTSSFQPGRGGVLSVATKFAVRGIVASLARELAPDVRVNGVAPGGTIGTDLRGPAALGLDAERLDDRPDRAGELRTRTPLGVALTPADHAWAYVYLASDRSRGTTGTFLQSDGGTGVA
jgi:2,3-dihydroxy-2,3-dihydrophenylpropionate dehydrogenase